MWNGWLINQNPWFTEKNPMTIDKATSDIVLTPKLLVKGDVP